MVTSDPIPSPPPDPPAPIGEEDYPIPRRPWLIYTAMFAAFVIFFAMVLLLYFRWVNSKEPNSALLVHGNPQLAGLEVHISGPRIESDMVQRLSKDSDYDARFALPSGTYVITIRKDQRTVAQSTINMREGLGFMVDLTRTIKPATIPATQPADQPAAAPQ